MAIGVVASVMLVMRRRGWLDAICAAIPAKNTLTSAVTMKNRSNGSALRRCHVMDRVCHRAVLYGPYIKEISGTMMRFNN